MSEALSNAQVPLLCDIGEHNISNLTGDNKQYLERLESAGCAEPTKEHPGAALKLTAKGTAFLAERGAGLNEA
jgi:hypothetical protein